MRNKKLILILGILVLLAGGAAFVAGRMFNSEVNPLGPFGLGGNGDGMSISVNVIPALELPITSPEVTGPFMERQDNTLFIETKSLKRGSGIVAASPTDTKGQSGPRVQVVVTNETIIYRETTQLTEPLSDGNQTIQQTVEEARLDDLNTQSMVMVWGRKSGDRVIAEVLMYSQTVMIKRAIFED